MNLWIAMRVVENMSRRRRRHRRVGRSRRELLSEVMRLAQELRRRYGWSMSRALREAWRRVRG